MAEAASLGGEDRKQEHHHQVAAGAFLGEEVAAVLSSSDPAVVAPLAFAQTAQALEPGKAAADPHLASKETVQEEEGLAPFAAVDPVPAPDTEAEASVRVAASLAESGTSWVEPKAAGVTSAGAASYPVRVHQHRGQAQQGQAVPE